MKRNILLGVSGSVAAIYAPKLAAKLSELGEVKTVLTDCGQKFCHNANRDICNYFGITGDLDGDCPELSQFKFYTDKDDWLWKKMGDPILHIDLAKWANCFVVAPLSMNTLAKFHCGLCDNLLTSIFRAYPESKPIVLAPAANTEMWKKSITKQQIFALELIKNISFVDPVVKTLACKDVGIGALADHDDIVNAVRNKLTWLFPLEKCSGIPINHHPGAFGFHRKRNYHTGVDLYCEDGDEVIAVEDGIVVKKDNFTGPKVGHSWWEETQATMIEGASGVVNYGEITCSRSVGEFVRQGELVGKVKRVLFEDKKRPDIPGHSTSMLHLELYKHGTREFADWESIKEDSLLDPTSLLIQAKNAPSNTLTWQNSENLSVG